MKILLEVCIQGIGGCDDEGKTGPEHSMLEVVEVAMWFMLVNEQRIAQIKQLDRQFHAL